MERAAFLIEKTGQTISCLLNPENVQMRRQAGIQPRYSITGKVSGGTTNEDPLLYAGGGRTELDLQLLFDVDLTMSGSSITTGTEDVRDLTQPLWKMTGKLVGESATGDIPLVHFIWGKAWKIPGLISNIAERLEQFTNIGVPRRSWVHLRMIKVTQLSKPASSSLQAQARKKSPTLSDLEQAVAMDKVITYNTSSAGDDLNANTGAQLPILAHRYLGNAEWWPLLARFNNVENPSRILAGTVLRIPVISEL
jgi:hypothetical protein